VPKEGVHADHAAVLAEGKVDALQPQSPVAEGTEAELKLVELDKHDATSAAGKLDGVDLVVTGAAKLVGKKAKIRVERVLDGVAYASLLNGAERDDEPITFESEAEKPTRAPSRKKAPGAAAEPAAVEEPELEPEEAEVLGEAEVEDEDEEQGDEAAETMDGQTAAEKKKTRRGSRGGRGRKKKPAATAAGSADEPETAESAGPESTTEEARSPGSPRIHVPDTDLEARPSRKKPAKAAAAEGDEAVAEVVAEETNGADAAERPKKKTRRGSRGGRGRKKPAGAAAASANGTEAEAEQEPEERPADEYVPMSEWLDEIET
jgi:ribonuclease E